MKNIFTQYKREGIAEFMKVSKEQFFKDWIELFGDKLVDYDAIKLPHRATVGSAGYDFYSPFEFTLAPGASIKFPTGIRVAIDHGWFLACFPRSGLGFKYRLQLDNSIGVVDEDYFLSDNEGHMFFKLTNDSKDGKTVTIKQGDAFAQGIFIPYGVTINDDTYGIRNGGFGSTGM